MAVIFSFFSYFLQSHQPGEGITVHPQVTRLLVVGLLPMAAACYSGTCLSCCHRDQPLPIIGSLLLVAQNINLINSVSDRVEEEIILVKIWLVSPRVVVPFPFQVLGLIRITSRSFLHAQAATV